MCVVLRFAVRLVKCKAYSQVQPTDHTCVCVCVAGNVTKRMCCCSILLCREEEGMSQAGEVAIENGYLPLLVLSLSSLYLKSNKVCAQSLTHLRIKELAQFLQV